MRFLSLEAKILGFESTILRGLRLRLGLRSSSEEELIYSKPGFHLYWFSGLNTIFYYVFMRFCII